MTDRAEQQFACAKGAVLVVSCSGGSSVGQIANTVARRLDASGDADFRSIVAIAAGELEAIEEIRRAGKVLLIDGCPKGCGKKCMDRAGLCGYAYLVVTEHGVDWKNTLDAPEAEVGRVTAAGRKLIAAAAKGKPCCCGS